MSNLKKSPFVTQAGLDLHPEKGVFFMTENRGWDIKVYETTKQLTTDDSVLTRRSPSDVGTEGPVNGKGRTSFGIITIIIMIIFADLSDWTASGQRIPLPPIPGVLLSATSTLPSTSTRKPQLVPSTPAVGPIQTIKPNKGSSGSPVQELPAQYPSNQLAQRSQD
ncbi:hypothetical protein KQX54_005100 [Cotesia glomerata]|uniref:Uncharacterized protein n=1 Tax=Cotesia glomerata TaxID=32391 RepID=A0AAV7HYX4_COTGL|nr:hypothetical protein KQX54_005100 [Cotesia glomerata]